MLDHPLNLGLVNEMVLLVMSKSNSKSNSNDSISDQLEEETSVSKSFLEIVD